MHFEVFDATQADKLNQSIVPFQFIGCAEEDIFSGCLDVAVGPVPMLLTDTTERPDVADLARVLVLDKLVHDYQPPLIYCGADHPGAILQVVINDPVQCRFSLFVAWPREQEVLRLMATHGVIYVLVGEDRDWQLLGLRVNQANQDGLAQAIRVWRCRDAEGS